MIPNDPQSLIPDPQSLTPAVPQSPFWDYTDLFLFILLGATSLAVSLLVALAFTKTALPLRLLLVQTLWYALTFGSLKALLLVRYEQPFWQSLGWRPISFRTAAGAILAGPVLVIGLGLLQLALRSPEAEPPFSQMLGSRGTIVLFGILAVVLGPIAEELAFRGFLMPLMIRSLGTAGGIVVTGFLFGSIHGYEYQWAWQYMLLISLVGCVFGWTKYKTKSTLASALMHSAFNLTQFAALLAQQKTL
jgi:hypothetical protein